jgi:ribosome-binding factor A
MPTRGAPRRLRVERDLHDLVVGILGGLSDPRLAALRVTRGQRTDDLSCARIFGREQMLEGDEPSQREKQIMRGLEAATGRVRTEVAQSLQLRRAPELRFVYDHGQENADRVDALLAEIHDEVHGTSSSDP